ncbi:MAG: hypothetical protein ABSF77_15015 [Spirochaetia bacterium]|jgi:hypothetical protein
MDRSRKVACTLIAAAAIAGFFGAASPCYGQESQGQGSGSTYLTFLLTFGSRVGLEYRWPAGPGVEVAIGSSLWPLLEEGDLNIAADALVVLPLFRLGRSGTFDLALGMLDLWWIPSVPMFAVSFGAAARLRFDLGSRWSLFVRAGAGYPFYYVPKGEPWLAVLPDLGIGAAFRL